MNRGPAADMLDMARVIAALLFFFIGSVAAQAQSDQWDYLSKSPERLIGLLDLPDIVAGGCGPAPNRATARVFGAPSQNGPSAGTLYWHEHADVVCELMIEKAAGVKEEVPTLEIGYEIPAAIVYERRGQWFRIRLQDGSAWIRRSDQHDFHPYPDILRENLASTMHTWDGTLRATPGAPGRVMPLSPGWKALLDRMLSIQYLGVTDVGGWIPAYHTDRTPLVWFASRGC